VNEWKNGKVECFRDCTVTSLARYMKLLFVMVTKENKMHNYIKRKSSSIGQGDSGERCDPMASCF
jgi:hypothetical protein